MTRILHIGPFTTQSPPAPHLAGLHSQAGLRRALANLGEYRALSWQELLCGGRDAVRWAIRGVAEEFRPDWTFLQAQRPDAIDPETLAMIPGKVFSWSGDVRDPLPPHYLERAPHVACTSFTNVEDVDAIRAAGHRAEFLQVGFDPERYFDPRHEHRHGIVFIGNHYPRRGFPGTDERLEMCATLRRKYGRRFRLYGSNWPESLGAFESLGAEDEARVLQFAKIAVCQNHFVRGRYTSDRTFRSMGCGALVLQREFPGMVDELGEVGITHMAWGNPAELCDAIDFYCANEELRSEVAIVGAERAHSCFTWERRVEEFAGIMRGLE